MAALFVYVTTADPNEAETIGRTVVEAHLAACANIIPGMRSIYRWQGQVERGEETVLILKTSDDRLGALTEKVKALHSYDCPCVAALPVIGGNPDYLAWIAAESHDPDKTP